MATTTLANSATFTTYATRNDFNAATGNLVVENFEGVVGEPSFNGQDLSLSGFTRRNDSPFAGFGFVDEVPAKDDELDVNGFSFTPVALSFSEASVLRLDFAAPITAFGADFSDFNDNGGTEIVVSGSVLTPAQAADGAKSFFGFSSDMPFSSITFRQNSFNEGFGADNFSYSVASVPLPAGIWMFLGSIGALMVARRRGGAI